jgi:glycosyltransferase involved in cell wall biosynthesis
MNIALITSCLKGRTAAFEWIAAGLRDLGHRVLVLHIDNEASSFEKYMANIPGVQYQRIQYGGQSKLEMARAFLSIVKRLIRFKAEAVHTHYLDANLLGLTAALMVGVRKRIQTRHTSTQYYRYSSGKWNHNKFFNKISTEVLAISDVVVYVLKEVEKVPEAKIVKIHHGFDFSLFDNIPEERLQKIRQRYGIPESGLVIGAISRCDEWKGVEYIVEGFKKLRQEVPDAFFVLANAGGVRYDLIKSLLSELPAEAYCAIKYENDLFALLKVFDVFVHVPIDAEIEAYGQVYVEAMAAEVPVVCTLSGIANEFVQHEINAIVVDYKSGVAICEGIKKVISSPDLKMKITRQAKRDVLARFSKETMVYKLNLLFRG